MIFGTYTWKHIRRSPYHAAAAVLTMFLSLLMGGFFLIVSYGSVCALHFFESKPQITVFFSEKAGEKEAIALKKTIENTGKTAGVTFVSKEEALAIYQEQYKSDPLLLEMVSADILPASLEVSAKDPLFLQDLEPIIRSAEGVEEVVYQKDVVDSLLTWTKAIRVTGASLAGLLIIDSLLIIMTVIGMKIAMRRDEVEILRLVGASPWYIRRPFLWEGGFYGVAGATGAWIVLTLLILWSRTYILSFLGIIPEIQTVLSSVTGAPFLTAEGILFIVLVAVGFILGIIGSLVSVGRYLKI